MKQLLSFFCIALLFAGCRSGRSLVMEQTDTSTKGMVTAGHPLAVQAGAAMLDQGGNAVDAAVAAAFALAVVEPSMSGLGGRLQAIVHLPSGEIRGIDATSQSPANYDTALVKPGAYGYTTIGIPGVVAGLNKLLTEYGTLPLATVMGPAIRYAEEGFSLLPGEARRQAMARKELLEFNGSRRYFLQPDSSSREAGIVWVQSDLANTLKTIAREGADALYRGSLARQIVADMQANGGLLTLEDLASYEAKDALVVSGSYRGYDLHGLWLPSYGAITIEILQILENLPMDRLHGADWASAFYQALTLAYEDRARQSESDTIARLLTSPGYARNLATRIRLDSAVLRSGYHPSLPESWQSSVGHTTHLSTADRRGMTVALTQSLGPNMGSKVATPGLGFLYAVSLGPYLGIFEPGQRVSSHISPFLVTHRGKPFLVLGAAGGSTIVPAVAAVISRVIDHQLPLAGALAAPRVFADRNQLLLETQTGYGWTAQDAQELKQEGYQIKEVPEPANFGRVHAIQFDSRTRKWTGAADPDWEGAAQAPKHARRKPAPSFH